MKETGIIMSGDHPAKIIAGIKTMTRRTNGLDKYNKEPDKWNIGEVHAGPHRFWSASCDWSYSYRIDCPYGQVGDRLWVRETFWIGLQTPCLSTYITFANGHVIEAMVPIDTKPMLIGKHPSIHLPRYATRIWLEITEVRVERLQKISLNDIRAEGIPDNRATYNAPIQLEKFVTLWDPINAKRGYGWEINPWVWAIEFRKIQ